MTSAPRALIFISQGTEELEFVTVYDVLVRAGVSVESVYVGSSSSTPSDNPHSVPHVTCSRGVKIIADLALTDLDKGKGLDRDAVIVPGGGPGAKTISENEDVQALLQRYYADGKVIATICAGTLAVKTSGIAKDSTVTSHPSVKEELSKDYKYSEDRVVVSDKLITSRGPGTALLFALTIVEQLMGKEKRDEVAGPMVLSDKL